MVEQFQPIATSGLSPDVALSAHRVNSLGSFYWFLKVTLRRKRLTQTLHKPLCLSLEQRLVKQVYEMPRDHFKSTMCTEGLPMWRALPFTAQDADLFKKLGYSDEFVKWQASIHDPNIRMLLVSENSTNATKLGTRVRWHFESNSFYRTLFPETLPDSNCRWGDYSLVVKRTGGGHGEGTFDFIGVGGALQSRHYNLIIQDDLVGRKAVESASIMEKTIDYHRLLINAYDSEDPNHEQPELIIGNRWSYHDLNSWVRENEPWFTFNTHSALGGCCPTHPPDVPILPEEFSVGKLMQRKQRLGSYHFSCQFLNNPAAPENADFRAEWLQYYELKTDHLGRKYVHHEVKNGTVRSDLYTNHLSLAMAVDPNHAGNSAGGRCRHAIVVVGLHTSSDGEERYYLLETWAQATTYDTFVAKMYKMAEDWGLTKFGLETVAAQKYLKYHIEFRNRTEGRRLRIIDLKGEVEAPDGTLTHKKEWRVRNVLSPIFEQERFWVQRKQVDFFGEYTTFPKGKYVDQLDALAYVPQMLRHSMSAERHFTLLQQNQRSARKALQPYSTGAVN